MGETGLKDSLLLLTDRPPNLGTPLKYFKLDYTPNNVFFVRWHLAGLPDSVNLDTFRLRIGGNVNKELALSVNDLITKFQPVTITAVCQCTGRTMEEWGDGQCKMDRRETERYINLCRCKRRLYSARLWATFCLVCPVPGICEQTFQFHQYCPDVS
jgi:hypothetical protein